MNKPLIGAFLAALLLGAGIAPAVAAENVPTQEAAPTAKAVTFAGTVALSNCSGSVVRSPDSAPTDPALVLSNGHCLETGFPGPG
ncbi:serine protease, partial [Streptomyces sp. SID8455]|nr:serine protease [Streptomyces sp. SID8455]